MVPPVARMRTRGLSSRVVLAGGLFAPGGVVPAYATPRTATAPRAAAADNRLRALIMVPPIRERASERPRAHQAHAVTAGARDDRVEWTPALPAAGGCSA